MGETLYYQVNPMKKWLKIVLIIILFCVFLFSTWQVIDILMEYRKGTQTYESLEHYVSIPETVPQDTVSQKDTPEIPTMETLPEEAESPFPKVNFDALKAINEDVIGWIYIPDTRVNYPIVQGENNDQYLYHLLTGEYNSSGSIFLDANVSADFSGRNSIIYGHNMKNKSMFADTVEYKKQEFYDTHPTAMLMTPEKNYYVHLFAGYVTDSWGNSWITSFTDEEFEAWLQNAQDRSRFTSNVTPTVQDKVLTFSTCTYDTHDARFIVHGILEEYIPENQMPAG